MISFKTYSHEECRAFFVKYGLYIPDSQICAIPVHEEENLAPVRILIYCREVFSNTKVIFHIFIFLLILFPI